MNKMCVPGTDRERHRYRYRFRFRFRFRSVGWSVVVVVVVPVPRYTGRFYSTCCVRGAHIITVCGMHGTRHNRA